MRLSPIASLAPMVWARRPSRSPSAWQSRRHRKLW